jgi:bacterioferritin-associated ferredoxin
MVLCICRSLTDREVDAAIQDGARSLTEVAEACGAGTDCGSCLQAIEARLSQDGPAPCGKRCADCPHAGLSR